MAKLRVLYDVNRVNLPINPSLIKANAGSLTAYDWVSALADYKEGIVVEVSSAGYVVPATGSNPVVGFLVQDAAGLFLENPAAQAAGLVAVTYGQTIVEVDGDVADAVKAATPGTYVSAGANGVLKAGAADDAELVGLLIATHATDASLPEGAVRIAVK